METQAPFALDPFALDPMGAGPFGLPAPPETPEEWRAVPGYPRLLASDRGRVIGPSGRILAQCRSGAGYRGVNVRAADGRRAGALVHRLVALAFLPTPPGSIRKGGDFEIDHGNGDKTDNRPANLEWVSHRVNQRRASALGLMARGALKPNSKLSPEAVRDVRRRLAAGESLSAIGRARGVSAAAVRAVKTGKAWAWVD